MGNSSSRKLTPEEEWKRQDEERRKELGRSGVLIPPSFGVGTSTILPPSSSASLHQHPYCFQKAFSQLPCNRLLEEHMVPGVWVSASTSPAFGSVLASYKPTSQGYEGRLCASQRFGGGGLMDLRAHNEMPPSVSGYYALTDKFQVNGTIHASGKGWFGCNLDTEIVPVTRKKRNEVRTEYYRNDPFVKERKEDNDSNGPSTLVKLGSWVQFQSNENRSDLQNTVKSVTGFGALETKGYTGAIEATIPIKSWHEAQVSYMASFDLNSEGPPLTVTLAQTPSQSSMSLSQVMAFDRAVTNVLEERCPKIRNTLGWSVQMTKPSDSQQSKLAAGAAWQINRGLAMKVVASPENGVTAGILLKRWKEPRVTCSLLFGSVGRHGFGFRGVGVEFETGPPSWQSSPMDLYDSDSGKTQVGGDAPITKATLPPESQYAVK